MECPTPKAILTGHQAEVSCLAVIAELGIVVSGSKGKLLFFSFSFCYHIAAMSLLIFHLVNNMLYSGFCSCTVISEGNKHAKGHCIVWDDWIYVY